MDKMDKWMKETRILQYNTHKIALGKQELVLGIYILCYFLVNISFLTQFPFVHSDESWLAGLTRNMMETGDPGVTETFFDLKPRYPHAIKILFHILQMPALSVQYGVFSARLVSLDFGCVTLLLFYRLLKSFFKEEVYGGIGYPILGTVFLSFDIQFIYAGHFARPEIMLVCGMIACILSISNNRYFLAALITGLSIGIHPNSFLIGTMCGAMLIPSGREGIKRAGGWKPLLGYAAVTSIFAAAFVSISLFFDREFFRHYLAYGNSEFDIGAPVTAKLMELPYFLQKIWYGVSGTYYVPDIRLEFILFALAAAASALLLLLRKTEKRAEIILTVKGIVGLIAGMVIIGRYNQTSIIFLFPLFFVLILLVIESITRGAGISRPIGRSIPVAVLILSVAVTSLLNISPWLNYRYEDYTGEIAKAVTPENRVLANLNCDFYFDNGKLFDYRNLSYLKEKNMTIEDYVRKNKIEYIILSDEMDLIYSQRPVWNIIYGNVRYMDELHQFIRGNCTPVYRFTNNTYGIRIVQYMNSDRDFTVQIFKVKDFS